MWGQVTYLGIVLAKKLLITPMPTLYTLFHCGPLLSHSQTLSHGEFNVNRCLVWTACVTIMNISAKHLGTISALFTPAAKIAYSHQSTSIDQPWLRGIFLRARRIKSHACSSWNWHTSSLVMHNQFQVWKCKCFDIKAALDEEGSSIYNCCEK